MTNLQKAIKILSQIADPVVRENAVRNIQDTTIRLDKELAILFDNYTNPTQHQVIKFGFAWEKTPENYSYWFKVNTSHIPLLPETQPVWTDELVSLYGKEVHSRGIHNESFLTLAEWLKNQ